jgi:hypothetical protein
MSNCKEQQQQHRHDGTSIFFRAWHRGLDRRWWRNWHLNPWPCGGSKIWMINWTTKKGPRRQKKAHRRAPKWAFDKGQAPSQKSVLARFQSLRMTKKAYLSTVIKGSRNRSSKWANPFQHFNVKGFDAKKDVVPWHQTLYIGSIFLNKILHSEYVRKQRYRRVMDKWGLHANNSSVVRWEK